MSATPLLPAITVLRHEDPRVPTCSVAFDGDPIIASSARELAIAELWARLYNRTRDRTGRERDTIAIGLAELTQRIVRLQPGEELTAEWPPANGASEPPADRSAASCSVANDDPPAASTSV